MISEIFIESSPPPKKTCLTDILGCLLDYINADSYCLNYTLENKYLELSIGNFDKAPSLLQTVDEFPWWIKTAA